ncbi:FAD-dependent monooxygenase [Actinospica sp.]|jgi:2-polyprenyl-6-methoxyphenol hydroxylase-like FAD-dependent oxidoreductase|uniref:FAD-dependent monooxygenase n=1 Tax=Actinospica sp. TaxID=1872142 RepID=UPI002BBDDC33|nr:FAD-dependent monooxygenase [Actinospica sp.]HWG26458.1 FAD-dependent monooxygenase [Actinospica sp.]
MYTDTSTKVRTALVIGGGIAGPVTATALVKAGIQATVHEAYPAPTEGIGGSLALAPNGMAALGLIGADAAVRAVATPIVGTVMAVGENSRRLPSLADVEPLQVVGRGDLQRVLRERAVEAGVRFEYGKRLIGADQGPNSVTARFDDGSSATADILIGADGVRSTVRTLIDPQAPGAGYTGMLALQGYVEAGPDLDPEPGVATFAFGGRAYYLYWKMADGRITWGANLPSKSYMSLTEARAIPAEQWLRTLRETYAGDVPGELLASRTTAENLDITGAIHIMPPVPHWHRGRMVLVGDAVHAPSNSTGQGASLAIESAIQLARCLRDLPDAAAAFTAYEGLRRERVERITKRGARTNSAKTPGPVARKVMHAMMPIFFKLMNFERTMGSEQRYRIDWDAPVGAETEAVR